MRSTKRCLKSSIKKHQQSQVVTKVVEDEKLVNKSPCELIKVDVCRKSTQLSNKEVFIGSKCTEMIKNLGLTPTSIQLKWFFDKVFVYYPTVSQYLQKYFKKGLSSTQLMYMTSLSPKKPGVLT